MKLYLSPQANDDLENIYTYIAEVQQTPIQAVDVMGRLNDSLDHIERNPYIGHATDYSDIYELVVGGLPYLIVYRIMDAEIEIVTVFHTFRHQDKKRRP